MWGLALLSAGSGAGAAVPTSHISRCASHQHRDSWDQMGSQVREKILNDPHSAKKVVSLKNEALALSTDVKKPCQEGRSSLG